MFLNTKFSSVILLFPKILFFININKYKINNVPKIINIIKEILKNLIVKNIIEDKISVSIINKKNVSITINADSASLMTVFI